MTAEDDGERDDKSAAAQRGNPARRQRPPVTIDLTAERISDKGERTGDKSPEDAPEPRKEMGENAASAGAPSEPAAAEREGTAAGAPAAESAAASAAAEAGESEKSDPPRTTRPPGASIIGSDDGWTRPALAGVAGGIVALILLIVLQASGLVPSPGRSAALRAADQAKAASEQAAALDRRVSAVEMITQNLPGKSGIDSLDGKVAQLQKELGAVATQGDLTTLEGRLAALTKKVDGLPAGASPDQVAALAKRVAQLDAGGAGGNAGASAPQVSSLSDAVDKAQADLKALDGRVAALEDKVASVAANKADAARAVAVVALRRAADEGAPFATDLDLAAALGLSRADVAALRPYADKGVPTKAALAAEFPGVGDAIVRATTQANPNAGIVQRLVAGIGSLVTVRPTVPVAGNDPAAIVSRMQAAVKAGDLQTALNERDNLPDAGKAASADWAAAAKDRVAVDALIAKVAQSVKPAGENAPT